MSFLGCWLFAAPQVIQCCMAHITDRIWQIFTHDIAIDLGTANTLVALRGVGVIIEEPSVVAINQTNQQILAVGAEAKLMAGKTPASVTTVRPLRDGVISEFDATEAMIRYFIQLAYSQFGKAYHLSKPRVVIGVPSLITEVEVRAVIDAAKLAGARKVYVVEEPLAAAIGVGLPVEEATGSMIIDVGGGTTDISLISMGGMVVDNTIRIAGDEMDQALVEYLRYKYNLAIGERTAEEIKIIIGSAQKLSKEKEHRVSGRDLLTGLPKTITFTSVEVREALSKVIEQIADAAKQVLEKAPAEMLSDLVQNGAVLAGGGAQMPGLDRYLATKLKIDVHIAKQPTYAVVNGVSVLLDRIDLLEKVQIKDSAYI